jgi:hypothetical protein
MPGLSPPDTSLASLPGATLRSAVASVTRRPLTCFAFWTGVLTPLAYPLFLLGDLNAQSLLTLSALVALNAAGLFLGRDYADRS